MASSGSYIYITDSDLTVPLAYDAKAETFVNRMEGYLTFKESRGKGIFSSSDNWTRMYFVIEGGDMYYYRKKEVYIMDVRMLQQLSFLPPCCVNQDFLLNPSQSIKNRPISLRKYVPQFHVIFKNKIIFFSAMQF